jgi:Asp-tRNA(Asn)/Glu-tRNA(Gln) amidotransferase A subunit family amidase
MAADPGITSVTAEELRNRIAEGALRASEVADAFIARIEAVDSDIGAWAWFDPNHVRGQAQERDAYRGTGRPLGPLHGLPVAIADVIDTAKVQTSNGTAIDVARVPTADAQAVARLKACGAVILGKTATSELGSAALGPTRNPAGPEHFAGTSSCGSAAAVASGMAPLAVGLESGGSAMEAASFCGAVGLKPPFGAAPRTGTLMQSPSLDTLVAIARSVSDAALLGDALCGFDAEDRATMPAPPPLLHATATSTVPIKPTFALVRTPFWDRADEECRGALEELAGLLGEQCVDAVLPSAFAQAPEIHARINRAEMARYLARYGERGDGLSETMRGAIETGAAVTARDYIAALDWPDALNEGLSEVFERCDAILTVAAAGPAPASLEPASDSPFNVIWALCRTPSVTLPIFSAGNGMPMGVQLVGKRGDDGRLLRTVRWLADFVDNAE